MGKKSMMLTRMLLPLLLFSILITGCATKEAPPATAEISYKVYRESFRDDDGAILLEVKFTYPEVITANDRGAGINKYYSILLDEFVSATVPEALEYAREERASAKSYGYNFHPHVYQCDPEISYNGNNLLSVQNTIYTNTGGAHPNIYLRSETFDLKSGKKLALTEIFKGSKEEILAKIYQIVLAQIQDAEQKGTLFLYDNYLDYLEDCFVEDDFFLTDKSIMFYYQLYVLAPYAAGIPFFELPYGEAESLALAIPELSPDPLVRELSAQAGRLLDRNTIAFSEIFILSMLDVEIPENGADGEVLFPVKDERFTTFADLESFVRNTYIRKEAEALLGSDRYRNMEGQLYADISKATGVGYYIDWNRYGYTIKDITEKSAVLHIYTTEVSPEGKKEKDVTFTVNIVRENGDWLFQKMFY